jgi:hypothetical protein
MPKLSTETLVRILTIVFTPVGAAVSAFGAKDGLQLPPAAVVVIAVAAAVAILGLGWRWLEKHTDVTKLFAELTKFKQDVISEVVAAYPAASPALSDIEQLLRTHDQQVVDGVAKAIGAPPSVTEVADQVVQTLAAKQLAAAVADRKVVDASAAPAPAAPASEPAAPTPAAPPAA